LDFYLQDYDEEDINIDVVSTDTSVIPKTSTTLLTPPSSSSSFSPSIVVKPTSPSLVTSSSVKLQSPAVTKPIAKVVHFSPKIIQVDPSGFRAVETKTTSSKSGSKKLSKQQLQKQQQQQNHKGLFIPPPLPIQTSMSSRVTVKEAPTTMTRVPRDENIPLIVYNPPRPKAQSMATPILPVLPMTTASGLIIQAPLFAPGNPCQPPTLISASQLKKLSKQPGSLSKSSSKQSKSTHTKEKKLVLQPPIPPLKIAPPTAPTTPIQPPISVVVKQEVVTGNKDCKEWSVEEVYDRFLYSDCAEFANIFKEQVNNCSIFV